MRCCVLEAVLREYPQVIYFRAGEVLSLFSPYSKSNSQTHADDDSNNSLITLKDVHITDNHICVYLHLPKFDLHCIILLDLVPSHAAVPTPKEMKSFVEKLKHGIKASLPHTFVLFLPSPIVSFQFISITPFATSSSSSPDAVPSAEGLQSLTLVLVTRCGLVATAAFVSDKSRWEVLSNTLHLCDSHKSHHAPCRWVESAQFHAPTRTLVWVEAGSDKEQRVCPSLDDKSLLENIPLISSSPPRHSIPPSASRERVKIEAISRYVMSARMPVRILVHSLSDTVSTSDKDGNVDQTSSHHSNTSVAAPTGMADPSLRNRAATVFGDDVLYQENGVIICPVLSLPVMRIQASYAIAVSEITRDLVQLVLSRNGCWLLVPLSRTQQLRDVCHDSPTAMPPLQCAVHYIDFTTGRNYDCAEFFSPAECSVGDAHDTTMTMLLLDIDSNNDNVVSRACSSVLILCEYGTQTASKATDRNAACSSALAMGRVSYCPGQLLVQAPKALPQHPSAKPVDDAVTLPCTPSCQIQSMAVLEGSLYLLFRESLVYIPLSHLIAWFTAASTATTGSSVSEELATTSHSLVWSVASSQVQNASHRYKGLWLRKRDEINHLVESRAGQTDHVDSGFRGALPSPIGVFTSRGAMLNVELKHHNKASSSRKERSPRAVVTDIHEEVCCPRLSDASWAQMIQTVGSIVPPLQHLQLSSPQNESRSSPTSGCQDLAGRVADHSSQRVVSSLVEILCLMDDGLCCFCCQRCGRGHFHATSQCEEGLLGGNTLATSNILSRLLSENTDIIEKSTEDSDSPPQMITTCRKKLAEFFANRPMHYECEDVQTLRAFDLNDFVGSIESVSDGQVETDCEPYFERVLKFWLLQSSVVLTGGDEKTFQDEISLADHYSRALCDFILVMLDVAMSFTLIPQVQCKQPTDGVSGNQCVKSVPTAAFILLRRCLAATLETCLRSKALVAARTTCSLSTLTCTEKCDVLLKLLKSECARMHVLSIHQDVILHLLAMCGDLPNVVNMLSVFGRYHDLLVLGRQLLDKYSACISSRRSGAVVTVSHVSSQRIHTCGQRVHSSDVTKNVENDTLDDSEDEEEGEDDFGDTWVTTCDVSDTVVESVHTELLETATESNATSEKLFCDNSINLSAACVTSIALHYRSIVRDIVYAALYVNEVEAAKEICVTVQWEQVTQHDHDLSPTSSELGSEDASVQVKKSMNMLVQEVVQELKDANEGTKVRESVLDAFLASVTS